MRPAFLATLLVGVSLAPWATARLGAGAGGFVGQAPPTGGIDPDNSGYPLERDACLTVALGPAAAAQCGSLRIIHPLPSIRTFNKLKTPTLIYNSEFAHPYAAVPVYVTQSSTTTTPDSVEVDLQLKVNGVYQSRVKQTWPGSEWPANLTTTRRVTVVDDALTGPIVDTTGYYPYQVILTNIYPGNNRIPQPTPSTGKLFLTNRSDSPFGAGWWLSGLEKLKNHSPAALEIAWFGGDGSARCFLKGYLPGDTTWATSTYDKVDTLYYDIATTRWTKTDAGGVRTKFDAAGNHIQTIDRFGRITTFGYTSGRLTTITIPPSNVVYTFGYTSGRLTSVTAPQIGATPDRVTTITNPAGQINAIQNPGAAAVSYAYMSTSGNSNLIATRTNRRAVVDTFVYDSGRRIRSSRIKMGGLPAADIILTLFAGETRGAAKSGSPSSADTAKTYALIDGPRTDVADTTVVFQSRFGPPRRVVDAVGSLTTVQSFPCMNPFPQACGWHPMRVGNPVGRTLLMRYDGRGNIKAVVDSVTSVAGQRDSTRYAWDGKFDQLTLLVPPEVDSTVFGVDATNGNRLWQQPGADTARRVSFNYYATGTAAGMLRASVQPGNIRDSVTYSSLANTSGAKTPLGQWTRFDADPIGRDTVVSRDIVIGGASKQVDTTAYDLLNRVTTTKSYGPLLNGAVAQSVRTSRTYDLEGDALTVARWSTPDPTGIATITTTWRYDNANRAVAEIASNGLKDSTLYDLAGNVKEFLTRRGHRLARGYDKLNRLTADTIPAVDYPASALGIAARNLQPAYQYLVSGDTTAFSYDPIGNLTAALNRNAKVNRTYTVLGRLETDSLQIRDTSGAGFANHRYGIRNTYDRNGRRITLRVPTQLGANGADSIRFTYDPVLSVPKTITDILNNQFKLSYNLRLGLDSIGYPGLIGQRLGYDNDGRLQADTLRNNGSIVYPRHLSNALGATSYTYDARGLLDLSRSSTGFKDTLSSKYSGLGHLIKTSLVQYGTWLSSDAPGQYKSVDTLRYDALGNIKIALTMDTTFNQNGTVRGSSYVPRGNPTYQLGTGRLIQDAVVSGGTRVFTYDSAGNVRFASIGAQVSNPMEDRASYYRADGKLAATDWRSVACQTTPCKSEKRQLTEYRYDALGRRVWELSQPPVPNLDCNLVSMTPDGEALQCKLAYVKRYVWDGSTELVEIQMPLAAENMANSVENDTAIVKASRIANPVTTSIDPNPFFGRVIYVPGLAVDRPIAITRLSYADWPWAAVGGGVYNDTWGPFTLMPFWNFRGTAQDGAFADGNRANCQPATSSTNCVKTFWPIEWSAYDHKNRRVYPAGWHGGVLEDKVDKGFLNYRRNRYYDALTGQFTQEDPIGLAGGLNLYGFAGGDPVNFGDPFGLDTLRYNGRTLTLIGDDGKTRWSGRAYSGRPGTTASEQFVRALVNRCVIGIRRRAALGSGSTRGRRRGRARRRTRRCTGGARSAPGSDARRPARFSR